MRRPYTESEIRELIRSETAMQRIARKRRPVWPRIARIIRASLGSLGADLCKRGGALFLRSFHRLKIR